MGLIKAARHRVKLTSRGELSTHPASKRADPRAWEFETQKIDKVLAMDVIKPARNGMVGIDLLGA